MEKNQGTTTDHDGLKKPVRADTYKELTKEEQVIFNQVESVLVEKTNGNKKQIHYIINALQKKYRGYN